MAKLVFENSGKEYELPDGAPIQEPCEKEGIPFACSEGVCGTCIVEVVDGMDNLSEYTQAEEDFLGEMSKERLACQVKIKSGTVTLKY